MFPFTAHVVTVITVGINIRIITLGITVVAVVSSFFYFGDCWI